jgi:hypothetical protein
MEALQLIQANLKAPKGQKNKFGNYNFRSCEDILEALKPHLLKHGCFLTLSDDIQQIGERFYVKATATLVCGSESVSVSAFAREAESKKGMDDSQLTGSSSSYARKYALNGLFCIDDTKDADTQDNSEPQHRFKKGEKEDIITQVRSCLQNGDDMGLRQILDEYNDPEEKMKVWGLFSSTERSSIKALLG